MTGKNETSWSLLHSLAVPAALLIAEAAWTSLLVRAGLAAAHGPAVYLPYLAFALPAVLALLATAGLGRLDLRWWWHALAVTPIAIIGIALTAGTISAFTSTGLWWQVTTEPWAVNGHPAAVAAGAAWFVSALAWGRGIWVGFQQPSLKHSVASFALGMLAFVGIFAGRAHSDSHTIVFRDATSAAGWLFFLWFPLVAAAVALVRQREVERAVLERVGSRPSAVWLTVLAVPMLAVAVLALLIAVVIGPAAPSVGRGVAKAITTVWDGILAAGGWVAGLLSSGHGHGTKSLAPGKPTPTHTHTPTRGTTHSHPITIPTIVSVLLIALALLALGFLIYRVIRNGAPQSKLRWRPPKVAVEEERDSVFSWRHLGAQLWGRGRALFSSFRRRSGKVHEASTELGPTDSESSGAETVRQAYRRMLVAARRSGRGRSISETTRELQRRLTDPEAGLGAHIDPALDELTNLYDSVRYGGADLDELATAHAARNADTVAAIIMAVE